MDGFCDDMTCGKNHDSITISRLITYQGLPSEQAEGGGVDVKYFLGV